MKKQYIKQLTIFDIPINQPVKKNNVIQISTFEKKVEDRKRQDALKRVVAYAKTLDWQDEM